MFIAIIFILCIFATSTLSYSLLTFKKLTAINSNLKKLRKIDLAMIERDSQGYEIKSKDWFNGLSVDPGASLTDPRAVPPECKEFVQKIRSDEQFAKELTYKKTIEFLDKHYNYFEVPFSCGENINPAKVNTGAAKIFSFGLMTKLTESETLKLFGEYYRELAPNGDDHKNIRNFIKFGWRGVSFGSGLAIVSKLQAYDDTESAMKTQAVIEGKGTGWDADSDSWIP
eukprot:gene4930-6898_t